MRTALLDKLIWVLIFGGMLAGSLGLSMQRGGAALGWLVTVVGGVAVALGVVLILVRSRRS